MIIIIAVVGVFVIAAIVAIVLLTKNAVSSTNSYINESLAGSFVDKAVLAASTARNDVIINGYKSSYTLEQINELIDDQLVTSPYNVNYKSSSCVKIDEIQDPNNSESSTYEYSVCLIDEDGNGFTLTSERDLNMDTFQTGTLKDTECSCN